MPDYLAGLSQAVGHRAPDLLANFHSWRLVAGIGICAVIGVGLLAGPVMADRMLGTVSARARRVAPVVFVIGLAVLVLGLITDLVALDAIGGVLVGAVVLGLLAVNY
jgi:hypothetical protein